MSVYVMVEGKRLNRETFEPRAKRCSRCQFCREEQPRNESLVRCIVFDWLIDRQLSRKQAVCSRKTKPTEIKVTSSDENRPLWSEQE